MATDQRPDLRAAKKRTRSSVAVVDMEPLPSHLRTLGVGKKYRIVTYGCQMNVHDSEALAGLLESMGYEVTEEEEEADLILLNTCAIRENAEDKVFGELGRLAQRKREHPGLLLGICGCMPQEEVVVRRVLEVHPYVDLVFGTHNIYRLPYLLEEAYFSKEMVVEVWSQEGEIIEQLPKVRGDQLRAFVNIMYGCDKLCTYCIVPYTRGKERSRPPGAILEEVRQLAASGYCEVTLLGQNVNAYGKDLSDSPYPFDRLLDDLRSVPIPRVRFTTSHPRDCNDALIDVLAKRGNLVEHFHLPVQSGDDRILKRMGRIYNRVQYLDFVRRLRVAIPDIALTTDIIVGFPGETEEQFARTLSLLEEVRFDSVFSFVYSPRVGTPAASMPDDISQTAKAERLRRLHKIQNDISRDCNLALVGQVLEVLVEGTSKKRRDRLTGRTRTNKLIHFEGPQEWIGKLLYVQVTEANSFSLRGIVQGGNSRSIPASVVG
ncbi:tRNA (N6-isopentenyl adenosine(37)-C2)-methylthiotransferase MiaB [Pasteuria penetrans]|uniref:tRNA (N6-isopentenyl adenosine(37)-C2)-methylthiotransferase MiaB n=1 Tax=Pasteuria penetrans TaxID=86005 RepID=UPI000F94B5B0|nr:tRNA (N6-isopentenyl adenosine(37)-C2)-methylthiotransferase MiaB [Pasteuria penetrans]